MSDHDASLRLNLQAAGMLSTLQQLEKQAGGVAAGIEHIGDEAKKSEKKIHPFLGSAQKGLGAAKTATLELGRAMGSLAQQALSLGGALSFGAGVKTAVDLQAHYKDMAFAIRTGTGEAMRWEEVQKTVEGTAGKWKRSNEEVAHSFDEIFRETNNLEFAKKATEAAAKAATASGKPLQLLGNIAMELSDKFGVAGGDIEEALATIVGTNKVEEFGASMDRMGAAARSLGLTGKDGLAQFVGMLEASGGATKDLKKAIAGLSGVMETLEDPEKAKAIEKELGVKLKKADGSMTDGAIEEVLKATGGQKEELVKVFSGDALKIMSEYGRIYSKAFDESTGTFKERSDAAMDEFHKTLKAAVKKPADLDAAAEDRLKDPKARLQEAMNKVTSAFSQPKMLAAIDKMADKLPAIADALAHLLDFALDHPLLAGVGMVAAKPAMAFGQSMASDGASWLGKQFVTSVKESDVGKSVAEKFSGAVGGSGVWSTVGKGLGIAAAGYIAFEVGKALIDARLNGDKEAQNGALAVGVEGARAQFGSREQQEKARARLKEKIAELEDRNSGFGGEVDKTMAMYARMVTGDSSLKTGTQTALRDAKQDLAQLEAAMARGTEKGGVAILEAAKHIERAAIKLETKGNNGGTGGNGLPPIPGAG